MNNTKTDWTRAEVAARYERATGEAAPADATSTDLWVWANESIRGRATAREAARPNVARHEPGLLPSGGLACPWCYEAISEHRADFEKEEGRAPSKLELAGWLMERGREEEGIMASHLWLAGQAVVNG